MEKNKRKVERLAEEMTIVKVSDFINHKPLLLISGNWKIYALNLYIHVYFSINQ